MANKKTAYIFLFIFLISCLFVDAALSEEIKKQEEIKSINGVKLKYLSGVEFLTGYGHGRLRYQDGYRLSSIFIDMDFDLKQWKKLKDYPGLLQFIIEPFYSYVWNPDKNMEIGNNFVIKLGITSQYMKFQPYLKLSTGFIYITQDTREQSTHFNFNEYLGLGAHYFFKKDIAFTLEYRYRHISNIGIKQPNTGINTNFTICGVSFLF